jgi:hypothetical protein
VGLVDRHNVAGLFLPVFGEGSVVILIKLARDVIGDVEQFDFSRRDRDRRPYQTCSEQPRQSLNPVPHGCFAFSWEPPVDRSVFQNYFIFYPASVACWLQRNRNCGAVYSLILE